MSDGWTTVGEMPAGSVFETRDGRRWVAHRFNITNTRQVFEYQNGRAVHRYLPTDTHARPLTPVPVAPALDPTLRGLLLHALETGETHALHDWLTEANGDRDLADAVRENCARIADGWASQIQKVLPQIRPGHRAEEAVPHWVTVARTIGDSIRHPEKYTD
jgi:hypothetical protein